MPVWLALALVGCLVGSAQAARPESLEVRDRGASLGLLTITVMDDGSAYIAPDHLAALLKGAWSIKGERGTLTVGKRMAEFTRGQTRAIVHGQPIALDLPPRVSGRDWLVSRDFLGKGLPRLAPGVSLALPTEPRKPGGQDGAGRGAARGAALPLLSVVHPHRHRDRRAGWPTRWSPGDEEVRVRLPGLALAAPRVEEIDDGLVKEVRLEPVGAGAVLRVVLEGTAGRGEALRRSRIPYRLVLDIYRPEGGRRRGRAGARRDAAAPADRARRRPRRPRLGRHRPDRRAGEGSGARRHAARGPDGRGRGSASRWC